jgi:transcriptional regulator with XRE-family HTH domain
VGIGIAGKRGRKPDTARRKRAASLYARGLSLAQVGARLGCTRQTAHYLLRAAGVKTRWEVPVLCACCGALVAQVHPTAPVDDSYCGPCLAARPDAPFGVRLRSRRLAAGLTQGGLARRAGVGTLAVYYYEAGRRRPTPPVLARLEAMLGTRLPPPESGKGAQKGRGKGK